MSGFGAPSTGIARPSDATGEIRFIWMTDSHNFATSNPTQDAGMDNALVDATTWGNVSAVIHTGDIGDNQPTNVQAAFTRLRGTSISCPLIYIAGNHDEFESTPGTPNTSQIQGSTFFNRAAPLTTTGVLSAVSGTFQVRYIGLDCNYYAVNAGDPSVINSAHTAGDRIGHSTSEPGGGSYRQFKQAQLDWMDSVLRADHTSHCILMLIHYPPSGVTLTDYSKMADVLQTDGRSAVGLCGHVHPNATRYEIKSSDNRAGYWMYKAPAMQESGGWVRVRLVQRGTVVAVDELSLKGYTNPGGWTVNAPFQVMP